MFLIQIPLRQAYFSIQNFNHLQTTYRSNRREKKTLKYCQFVYWQFFQTLQVQVHFKFQHSMAMGLIHVLLRTTHRPLKVRQTRFWLTMEVLTIHF